MKRIQNRKTAPQHPLPDTKLVLDSIRQIVRALRTASREQERTHGVSSAQFFVLEKLTHTSGISLNELAERTFTHQSSVSVVVSRLARRGLVSRKPSKEDRRKLEISLTPAGRRLIKTNPLSVQDALVKALDKLPKARLAILADSLSQATRDAGLAKGSAPMFFEDL
jgi:DNA-binding MarR family transcriptional regulator